MNHAFDPDDRYVVLTSQVMEKVLREHPDMADYLDEILPLWRIRISADATLIGAHGGSGSIDGARGLEEWSA